MTRGWKEACYSPSTHPRSPPIPGPESAPLLHQGVGDHDGGLARGYVKRNIPAHLVTGEDVTGSQLIVGKQVHVRLPPFRVLGDVGDVRSDWTVRDDVRAKLHSSIKRLLVRFGYPPDKQPEAIKLVMEQMESMTPRFADARA